MAYCISYLTSKGLSNDFYLELEAVLLEHTGRCYSHKDMVHRRSLVHRLWLRMLESQGKEAKICWDSCNVSLLNKVTRRFNLRSL